MYTDSLIIMNEIPVCVIICVVFWLRHSLSYSLRQRQAASVSDGVFWSCFGAELPAQHPGRAL